MTAARLFIACEVFIVLAVATRLMLPSNVDLAVHTRGISVAVMPLQWFVPLALVVIAGVLSATTLAVAYTERIAAAIKLMSN